MVVTNIVDETVTIVDRPGLKALKSLPVQARPHGIRITPDDRYAYVGNAGGDRVSVVDLEAQEICHEITGLERPSYVAQDPGGKLMWVIASGPNAYVIDPENHEVVERIEIGPHPTRIVFSPDGKHGYLPDREANQAWAIDLESHKVEGRVDLPGSSSHRGLDVSADGRYLVCPNGDANSVSLVDTESYAVVTELTVGADALGATCVGTVH